LSTTKTKTLRKTKLEAIHTSRNSCSIGVTCASWQEAYVLQQAEVARLSVYTKDCLDQEISKITDKIEP
jgi:hypothetical protein